MSKIRLTIFITLFVPGFLVAKNRESLTNRIKTPMFHDPEYASNFGKNNFQYCHNSGLPNSEHVGFSTNPHASNFSTKGGLSNSNRFGLEKGPWRRGPANDSKNIICGRVSSVFGYLGVSYERLLSPNLGLEATVGLVGASVGANVYFPAIEPGKLTFRTGLTYGQTTSLEAIVWADGPSSTFYIPIGMNLLTRNDFFLSVDAGPQFLHLEDDYMFGFSVKIGRAF
jgi:hypothetical protein